MAGHSKMAHYNVWGREPDEGRSVASGGRVYHAPKLEKRAQWAHDAALSGKPAAYCDFCNMKYELSFMCRVKPGKWLTQWACLLCMRDRQMKAIRD